jgi:hypothetical protein
VHAQWAIGFSPAYGENGIKAYSNLLKPKSCSCRFSGLAVFPDLERRVTFVTPLA